ncbi:MAG: NIL domain-containing protein [Christensenellales bacterium]
MISTVSRDFGVDINIVLANVEVIEDNPLGGMIALLGGEEKQVAAALNYLNENHVYTEVIADGSI